MSRKEKRDIKHRIQVKARLRQFYSSYEYLISNAIKYADQDVRSKLIAIENLFSPDTSDKRQDLKKKKFDMPVTYHRYLEFRNMMD